MKVCFAVDGTAISEGAFDFYYDNIHKKSNTLVFCHVAKMLDFCSMSEESMAKINPQTILDALQSAEEDAKKVEKKFMEKMNTYEDVNVKGFHIKPGSNKPGESIIGTANREKCDLIIMGTRGLDDEKRLILGSVSDYIVHHSWIPTMVCPKASPKL